MKEAYVSVSYSQMDPSLGRYCAGAGGLAGTAAGQLDQLPGDNRQEIQFDQFFYYYGCAMDF